MLSVPVAVLLAPVAPLTIPVVPLTTLVVQLATPVVQLLAPVIQLAAPVVQLLTPVVQLPVPGHGQGFCATDWGNFYAKIAKCGGDGKVGTLGKKAFVAFFVNFIAKTNNCQTAVGMATRWAQNFKRI